MGKPAALVGVDMVKQSMPHCHTVKPPNAGGHLPGIPHPALPLKIIGPGAAKVMINNKPAAVQTDKSEPCTMGKNGCDMSGGPGVISSGSTSVTFNMKAAARKGDPTLHSMCVAPKPGTAGKIMTGFPKVKIG